jgi:hypothetical protein
MNKQVVVVGVAGVGMAHIIAAVRTGNQVVGIVDRKPDILRRVSVSWRNEFDGLVEEVETQSDVWYGPTIYDIPQELPVDMVIVCTPPHITTRLALAAAERFPEAIIVCEKPLLEASYLVDKLGDRLRLSSPYVFIEQARDLLREKPFGTITRFSGDFTNRSHWGYQLSYAFDWLPHLAGMLYVNLGKPDHYGWLSFAAEHDTFSGKLLWEDWTFKVTGFRHPSLPFELIVNGTPLGWQADLFDKQIDDKGGLPADAILIVDDIMRGKEA